MSLRWIMDEGGEIGPAGEPEKTPRPARNRRLLYPFLLVLLALLFIYIRQMQQVNAQEQSLAEEVAASYQVYQETVLSGDEELFITLLSTWDPAWQQAQKKLFNSGRLWDRSALGLTGATPFTSTIKQIEISPDWESAWVETGRIYKTAGPSGDSIDVELIQAYRFERSGFRWLASTPDEAFWGERQSITGQRVSISVPGRDADLARRLQSDLDQDLDTICAELAAEGTPCPAGPPIQIFFDANPDTLLSLRDLNEPVFQGETYLLPAPSLVGLPTDDSAYRALYRGFTTRILNAFRHNLSTPIPLPNQQIASLCFPSGGHAMKLFTVDPAESAWTMRLPERNFQYLSPAPDGKSIILQEYGRQFPANHLRLVQWQGSGESVLYDADNSSRLPRPVGWAGPVDDAHLLIHSIVLNRADIFYNWLDLEQCTAAGCPLRTLPGYTVWSPAGEHTLVTQRNDIWLGDHEGNLQARLDSGFNPFWLDSDTYGYARYTYPDGSRPVVEIVTGSAAAMPEITPRVRLSSVDLPAGDMDGQIFIDFVSPIPHRSGELFISGPGMGSGRYYGFQVSWSTTGHPIVRQVLDLPDTLRGHPGQITPTGYPPFGFSPDGRWLIGGSFNELLAPEWTLFVHDLETGQAKEFSAGYPTYPAQYPFYDWSADGQWLLIMDDGFLRLIAPAEDYERLLPHPHDNCLFSAWVTK